MAQPVGATGNKKSVHGDDVYIVTVRPVLLSDNTTAFTKSWKLFGTVESPDEVAVQVRKVN